MPRPFRTGATFADAAAEWLRCMEHNRGREPWTVAPYKVIVRSIRPCSEQDAAIFLTAAFTGLRRGELLALRWRDVDFAGSTIRVRGNYSEGVLTTPKSGKMRALPMAPDVASALAALGNRENWVGDDDRVFVGVAGSYLDGSALRRRYGAALERAGLRQLRFHDLRHTFGTRMIGKANIRRVQEWMGHSSIQTSWPYEAESAGDISVKQRRPRWRIETTRDCGSDRGAA